MQDLKAQMDAKRTKLERDRNTLQGEYDQMQAQLSGKLADAEKEVSWLQTIDMTGLFY